MHDPWIKKPLGRDRYKNCESDARYIDEGAMRDRERSLAVRTMDNQCMKEHLEREREH